jgi:hypothetical protein
MDKKTKTALVETLIGMERPDPKKAEKQTEFWRRKGYNECITELIMKVIRD